MDRAEDAPCVSVVVPTYNREALLRQAVESVFAQTFTDWELIIVDDGSADGTGDYLNSLSDPRVRSTRLEHCGNPAHVRNRGIGMARGRLLAFLDSDDLWPHHKLERQIGALRANPACGWSYTYFTLIDEEGGEIPIPRWKRRLAREGWILRDVISTDAWIAMPTVMVDRELMVKVGTFDESLLLNEDYEAWVRLAYESPVCLVAEPMAEVRTHPGNIATGRQVEVLESWAAVYRRFLADPAYEEYRPLLRSQYVVAKIFVARQLRADERYRAALRTLLAAFRYRPTLLRWWIALLETLLRPVTPRVARRAYRRFLRRLGVP